MSKAVPVPMGTGKLVNFLVFSIKFLLIICIFRLSKTSLPEGIVSYIKMCTTSYGKVSQCSGARQIHLTSWQLISIMTNLLRSFHCLEIFLANYRAWQLLGMFCRRKN
jgi:hypothetical protein